MVMMSIEQSISHVCSSLKDYCIRKCNSKCCRKGKLIMHNRDEVMLVTNGFADKLLSEGIIIKKCNGIYEFDLDRRACPSLSVGNMCTIYFNKNRPKLCREFPIFLRGKKIFISTFCEAEEILKESQKIFEASGYEVVWQ
jgi:Fe-S-cluster containining protein